MKTKLALVNALLITMSLGAYAQSEERDPAKAAARQGNQSEQQAEPVSPTSPAGGQSEQAGEIESSSSSATSETQAEPGSTSSAASSAAASSETQEEPGASRSAASSETQEEPGSSSAAGNEGGGETGPAEPHPWAHGDARVSYYGATSAEEGQSLTMQVAIQQTQLSIDVANGENGLAFLLVGFEQGYLPIIAGDAIRLLPVMSISLGNLAASEGQAHMEVSVDEPSLMGVEMYLQATQILRNDFHPWAISTSVAAKVNFLAQEN